MASKPIPIPEGLEVFQDGANVVIRRSWFTHTVWFLLFFCIAWDTFLIFWYATVILHWGESPMHWLAVLFPICHVAIGVGLTYYVLCTFLNRTDLILSSEEVTVRSHPLPWRGNQRVPVGELTDISSRVRYSGKRQSIENYDILYVDPSNHERTLLKGLNNARQAEYVVTALRRFYLLDDQSSPSLPKGSA